MYTDLVRPSPPPKTGGAARCHAAPPVGEYLHAEPTSTSFLRRMVPVWTLIACALFGLILAFAVGITTHAMMSKQMQKGSSTDKPVTEPGSSTDKPGTEPGSSMDKPVTEPEAVEFRLGGSVYLIGKYCLDTWATADRFCLKHGSKLATIETAQEWQNLHSYTKLADWPLWLGATNRINGTWHWVSTGAELTYSNWEKGHPVTSVHDLCALVWIWENSKWHASICAHHSGVALCEKSVSES